MANSRNKHDERIVTLRNLSAYMRGGSRVPEWPFEYLLYERIPTLAFRTYLGRNDSTQWGWWPVVYDEAPSIHIRQALEISWVSLREYDLARPISTRVLLRRLMPKVPNIVREFQRTIRSLTPKGEIKISTFSTTKEAWSTLVVAMAKAVAKITDIKGKGADKPMVGSKVMSFLFPELFPVWDTFWVQNRALKAIDTPSLPRKVDEQLDTLPCSPKAKRAAQLYAQYVWLMLEDRRALRQGDLKKVYSSCFHRIERKGYEEPQYQLSFYYADYFPLFFEVCLIGRWARTRKGAQR